MLGTRHGNHQVYLYQTMLHTRSPMLKEIYCESHRYEPWAVEGVRERYGRYLFPNVLYIESERREALLARIPELLADRPEYADSVERRLRGCALALERTLACARRGLPAAADLTELLAGTARMLSFGILKEAFEPEQAMAFLGSYLPVEPLRPRVLALYQPQCLPHFLKYELKLLFFAAHYALRRDEAWVTRCIAQAAWLSRFLVEDTPFDDPAAMRAELERVVADHGGEPLRIVARRQALLENHRRARREALLAERDILEARARFARCTARTAMVVKGSLKLIQLIATCEELKHIYAVRTGRRLNGWLKGLGLEVADTTSEGLTLKLSARNPSHNVQGSP